VIISSSLQEEQVEKLLTMLKKHMKAIGYKIGDLIGIDPRYCMHRIYLGDVVKKEILKLVFSEFTYIYNAMDT